LILVRPIARVALLLAALVCLLVPGAEAASLDVIGPPGSEVVVDGEVLGVLPLAAALELPHGRLLLVEVRRPGFVTHHEQVFLNDAGTEMVLEVDLLGLSRKTAVISSAILAGTGQFYQRRSTTGWIHLGLQLGAWASVVYGELWFQSERDDYLVLDQQYQQALAPTEIAEARAARDAAREDLDAAKAWRNVSIGVVVAIAAYSAFDAWRGHDRFFAGLTPASASLDGSPTLQAGLRWGFGGGAP
jgi:hypothetical protein